MFKILLSITILFSSSLYAKPKAYFEYEKESFFSRPKLIIDGKSYNYGAKLSEYMESNPMAQKYMEKSENFQRYGNSFLWGGLTAALIYLVSNQENADGSSSFDSTTYWGIFVFGGLLPATYFRRHMVIYRTKALNHYNGIYDDKASLFPSTNNPLKIGLKFNF